MITTIFALFILTAISGAKSIGCQRDEVLIFPQAAPVQFWLTGCDTYNETIPKGVHYKCFCQPWKCTDVIQIPFRETFDDVIEVENIVAITLPDLDEWQTSSLNASWIDWTEGVSPFVDLPYSGSLANTNSEYLWTDYVFEVGKQYSITINYTVEVAPPRGFGRIAILDDDFSVILQSGVEGPDSGAASVTYSFTATEATTKIAFIAIRNLSGVDLTITVNSASGTRTDIITTYPDPSTYQLVIYGDDDIEIDRLDFDALLIPEGLFYYHTANVDLSELGICEQQIRFEVEDLTSSPDSVVAKSDCQSITESDFTPTILIEYSSPKNYNGLVFEGVSPDPEYNIRIPAVFFHEDILQADEVAKLTSKVIKLNSQTELKRLLETDFMPYYMHIKIALILSMPLIQIDGLYWTKQDAYEKDDGSKRWPVKRYTCLLTQRDFLERQSI